MYYPNASHFYFVGMRATTGLNSQSYSVVMQTCAPRFGEITCEDQVRLCAYFKNSGYDQNTLSRLVIGV